MYYVFEALAGAQRLLPVSVSDPQRVAALAFQKADGRGTCLLANLTRWVKELELEFLAAGLGLAKIDEAQLPAARAGAPPAWRPLTIHRGTPALALSPNALLKLEFP